MSNQTWKLAESIGIEQAQAMDEVLALLDAAEPSKFVALLGSRNSASVLINDVLGKNLLRTPAHRKLMGVVIDATRLPSHIEAWQYLLFAVMDKLAEAPNARGAVIGDLRDELNEVVALERRQADSSGLASAAFASHFRSAFPGIVNATVASSNSLLVVGLDKLDQVDGIFAMDLLEASRYFLNAPDCAVLAAADEAPLIEKLKIVSADGLMVTWPTERVAVPERLITRTSKAPLRPQRPGDPAKPSHKPNLGTLPSESAKVIKDMLDPDQRLIETACEEWHYAIERLTRRNEEGSTTRISGAHIAKLVTLKLLSPRLFEAAKFDASLLGRLERAARSGNADLKDDHQRVMAMTPKLSALFKSAPNFLGIETRDIATALRLVYGRDNEPSAQHTQQKNQGAALPESERVGRIALDEPALATGGRTATRPAQSERAPLALNLHPVLLLPVAGAITVLLDRYTKSASGAPAVLPNITTSSIFGNAAMLGLELIGLAICFLILAFWGGAKRNTLYQIAFGLIIGALGSNLYDHIVTGGVLNFLPIAGVAVNFAHISLLAGALILFVSMFQREPAPRVDER
jgi:hypothetical protein